MKNGLQNIFEGLKSSAFSLQEILFLQENFKEEQASWMGDLLKECIGLKTINLNFMKTIGKGFESICNGLKSSATSLQKMDLCGCNLSEEQGIWLGDLLIECKVFNHLHLGYNSNITDNGLNRIFKGLTSSLETLEYIDLSGCNITENQCFWLGDLLQKCIGKLEINLTSNTQMGEGFKRICYGLKSPSLQSIHFTFCNLSEEQGIWLSDLLFDCTMLTAINLTQNGTLKNEILNVFNGLTSSCNSLQQISLAECNLTEEQGVHLGNLLLKCKRLTHINLTNNKILSKGFKRICNGLKMSCFTLKHINLSYCDLSEEQAFCLGDLLSECTALKDIHLCSNCNMKNGFDKIYSGLKSSKFTLQNISILQCDLSEEQKLSLNNLAPTIQA
ncbi:unnamed protein product [Dimorphilus gyrociliatus]|uniref:Uncharacterized protein n=1 Tax=Dimorphilus gyrociliatus TaxID=2664684 RepID=A0A7I8WDY5_9ANNE|nr:unnamed protein product [Dimorphilus gyrociliatus]